MYMILFTFFLAVSCVDSKKVELPSSEGLPDQESWGVTIFMTQEGLMRAKVSSGHLEKYKEGDFIIIISLIKGYSWSERIKQFDLVSFL